MLFVDTSPRGAAPALLCDCCGKHIQGHIGRVLYCKGEGQQRLAEGFTIHNGCRAQFRKRHPLPVGVDWWFITLAEYFSLLAQIFTAPQETEKSA